LKLGKKKLFAYSRLHKKNAKKKKNFQIYFFLSNVYEYHKKKKNMLAFIERKNKHYKTKIFFWFVYKIIFDTLLKKKHTLSNITQ